jgi:ABC-type dipeptide/oligopeptide/nickel transport system ATPase component
MSEENIEANVISYRILVDSTGKLVTEHSIAEIDKVKDSFDPYTYALLETIIRTARAEFKQIHNKIMTEIEARDFTD